MYYVYILHSKKLSKRYIGYTDNLKKRFEEHNQGKTPFTTRGIPWQLLYYESFCNKKDAIEEERFLKSGKGRERLSYLLQHTMQEYTRTGSSTG